MVQPSDPQRRDIPVSAGSLVLHGEHATLFGAVGPAVPPTARMGIAEEHAAAARTMARGADARPAVATTAWARPRTAPVTGG